MLNIRLLFVFTLMFALGLMAHPVYATSHSGKYFSQTVHLGHDERYMTGDWNGKRTEMFEKGFDIESSYVCDILGNPTGGAEQALRYDHSIGLDLFVDLERTLSIKGGKFHTSGLYRQGRNLSDIINNALVVSSIFGHEQVRFYALTLEKLFLEDRLSFLIGRMGAQDEFIVSPLYWAFVTNAIDGMPINIPKNFTFPVYPTATWGARLKYNITDEFSSMTGVYNGDPEIGRDKDHGFDFSLKLNKGVLMMQEFNYRPRLKTSSCPEGLPARIMLGGYLTTADFNDLYSDVNGNAYASSGLAQKKHSENYGVYLHLEQMLYRSPESEAGKEKGLVPFVSVNFAPQDRNEYPLCIIGGIVYTAPFKGRLYDTFAAGITYMDWSKDTRKTEEIQRESNNAIYPQKYEISIDVTYSYAVKEWFYIQPDIQYIINPNGTKQIDDALVVGSRVKVIF